MNNTIPFHVCERLWAAPVKIQQYMTMFIFYLLYICLFCLFFFCVLLELHSFVKDWKHRMLSVLVVSLHISNNTNQYYTQEPKTTLIKFFHQEDEHFSARKN